MCSLSNSSPVFSQGFNFFRVCAFEPILGAGKLNYGTETFVLIGQGNTSHHMDEADISSKYASGCCIFEFILAINNLKNPFSKKINPVKLKRIVLHRGIKAGYQGLKKIDWTGPAPKG